MAIGTKLIKEQISVKELIIYKQSSNGKYEIEKIDDWHFDKTCEKFHFDVKDNNAIILFDRERCFKHFYNDSTKEE